MQAAGLALAAPDWPAGAGDDPVTAVRSTAAQAWLLEALRSGLVPDAPDETSVKKALTERLSAWHAQACRDARRFGALDEEARHRLRRRVKRLRYGLEFSRALFEPKRFARLLKSLTELQTRLGAMNDVAVARQALRAAPAAGAAVAFALGWLVARHATLVADCGPSLERFAETRPPWKR
jgi:CHAD domain-containing protein